VCSCSRIEAWYRLTILGIDNILFNFFPNHHREPSSDISLELLHYHTSGRPREELPRVIDASSLHFASKSRSGCKASAFCIQITLPTNVTALLESGDIFLEGPIRDCPAVRLRSVSLSFSFRSCASRCGHCDYCKFLRTRL